MTRSFVVVVPAQPDSAAPAPPPPDSRAASLQAQLRALMELRDFALGHKTTVPDSPFLREQLAGDEMDEPTNERLIATGFLRNYAKVGFREKDNPQFRFDYLDDMIATVGRGVIGLTVQCARCHDHKFDPIPQRDYYALQASLWGYVEVDHPLVPKPEVIWSRATSKVSLNWSLAI